MAAQVMRQPGCTGFPGTNREKIGQGTIRARASNALGKRKPSGKILFIRRKIGPKASQASASRGPRRCRSPLSLDSVMAVGRHLLFQFPPYAFDRIAGYQTRAGHLWGA